MPAYDAIVVGAGPNGLAAALRLAEAGWSVCLLEAGDEVGGAARTVESTLPGFRHDLGAAFLPLAQVSPAIAGRDLGAYGLRLLHAPLPAAHPFPGNQAAGLARSAAETAASIDKLHHGDGDAWIGLDDDYGDLIELLLRAQMVRWPVSELAAMARRLGGVQRGVEFARVLLQGADVIAGRFQSEQARAFLVAPAMHADLAPEAPGAGVYALLLTLLGQRHGMPVAEGGTGAVSAALAAKLRDAGGVILTGRRVERIAVSGGRATGAEAGGELFEARRALIAAVHPDLVVRMAGPESFPPAALEQIRRFRLGLGTFKVDWALDGPVPWLAEECRRAGRGRAAAARQGGVVPLHRIVPGAGRAGHRGARARLPRAGAGAQGLDAGGSGSGGPEPAGRRHHQRLVRDRPAVGVPAGARLVAMGEPAQGPLPGQRRRAARRRRPRRLRRPGRGAGARRPAPPPAAHRRRHRRRRARHPRPPPALPLSGPERRLRGRRPAGL